MHLATFAAVLAVPCLALAAADAPVSLTASDGTGLKLVKLQARAVVQDPLAFTELTLTFENPLDRTLEGQFKVTLPQGAALSRFAMKLDGRWQEGEVVEKQAARRAYEDFLHRRQDPALLEQSGGNEFTARVFPIPARGQKELVLSYSHELVQAGAPYVLPLKGLPEVGELDVKAFGVEGAAALVKQRFVPNADFVATPKQHLAGARAGDLVVARVVPVDATAADPVMALTLLVDSSGSRALAWTEQVKLVQQLVAALGKAQPALQVTVAAFDQDVAEVYAGPASGFGDAPVKRLRERRALGASNLELALQQAGKSGRARAVLVTDGVATAGATEGPNLQAALLKLKAAGVQRLDAIAVGGLRDEAALARLTAGALARDGAVLDGARPAEELARRLSLATRSKLDVVVQGASEAWPKRLAGVQAGDAVLVYAQLPASAPLALTVGGKAMPVAAGQLASIERPLLERAWAKARIAMLEDKLDQADGAPQRAAVKQAIIEVSTKQRVLSSLTALLVLETEADYARFHIDRRALADLLVVKDGRVSVQQRAADTLAVAKAPSPRPADPASPKARSKPALKPESAADGASAAASPSAEAVEADEKEKEEPAKKVAADERPAPRPSPTRRPEPMAEPAPMAPPPPPSAMRREEAGPQKGAEPYTGKFKDVMDALRAGNKPKAVATARGWHEEAPGDLLALVAMGEALEASGDAATAARAYGSIIDLFPARADLRRFAGVRLERLTAGAALALDSFARAAEQRPDHPASHRLYAFALLRAGQHEKAFEAIAVGLKQEYPSGRFSGVERILREDAGLIAAAWIKAEPKRRGEIEGRLKAAGGVLETTPSLRFVLNWETDANDVDFHIYDGKNGHAYYSQKELGSGGELYADVTTGYGPECFTIRLPKGQRTYPYTLQAHYYSIGPMGAGMGKLELIEHDGQGGLTFEQRPYVVMVNQAYVDLGVVKP